MIRYIIIDTESDLMIGDCTDILGFSEEGISRDYNEYDLTIAGLKLSDTYIQHYLATKSSMKEINLYMLDQEGNKLNSHSFFLHKPYFFHKRAIPQERFNLEVSGGFSNLPSDEAMKIWKQWVVAKPTMKNTWENLSSEQLLGWLEVIRVHSGFNKPQEEDQKKNDFYLDMTYVTDVKTFYCALGEAMNGPGGYYGTSLNGVADHFYGRNGAEPPFNLHFMNGSLNKLMSGYEHGASDLLILQQIRELLISNQVSLIE
ncbi:hypothetical protein DVH26_19830 [Paenibacillus sp. H1-7]|uniref:hypothetical protein n=1 Tax=Paenibacillus sp. H1-7 TaxID=2282849 RepID=UPI001EF81070|nr:hypothetical protein [Paenibacillus sp. H1-7]ULL16494.1 hypothetical protein DVH26_19830 [Paenibacillus sp. H1-7]